MLRSVTMLRYLRCLRDFSLSQSAPSSGNELGAIARNTDLRHVMKRHANNKQSNTNTHCNDPSAHLRIHDLDPLYFLASHSAPITTIATIATSTKISIEPSPPLSAKPK